MPPDRRAAIRHVVEPEIVFKGDPSTVGAVLSRWQYNDPKASRQAVIQPALPPPRTTTRGGAGVTSPRGDKADGKAAARHI